MVSSEPSLSATGSCIRILEAANTHVKTFTVTSALVVGNIAERLDRNQIERLLHELQTVSHVWGYSVPLTRVNLVAGRRG